MSKRLKKGASTPLEESTSVSGMLGEVCPCPTSYYGGNQLLLPCSAEHYDIDSDGGDVEVASAAAGASKQDTDPLLQPSPLQPSACQALLSQVGQEFKEPVALAFQREDLCLSVEKPGLGTLHSLEVLETQSRLDTPCSLKVLETVGTACLSEEVAPHIVGNLGVDIAFLDVGETATQPMLSTARLLKEAVPHLDGYLGVAVRCTDSSSVVPHHFGNLEAVALLEGSPYLPLAEKVQLGNTAKASQTVIDKAAASATRCAPSSGNLGFSPRKRCQHHLGKMMRFSVGDSAKMPHTTALSSRLHKTCTCVPTMVSKHQMRRAVATVQLLPEEEIDRNPPQEGWVETFCFVDKAVAVLKWSCACVRHSHFFVLGFAS